MPLQSPSFRWRLLLVVFIVTGVLPAWGAPPVPETPAQRDARIAWWRDARFGMFIHWGPVSLKETEISWSRANSNPACPNQGEIPVEEYDNLYKRFNPVKFDAREWVRIAKASGMKYMVLTAKHGDGFLLFDSKVSDHNIMHTPFGRDVCAELAQAAHEEGMRIGWYFSPMDWRDPDCRSKHNDRFVKNMQAELRELLTNYGKIDLLWFDVDGRSAPWDQENTYALVKQLQPEIVINNRLDYFTRPDQPHVSRPESVGPNADYFTPEQFIGGYEDKTPWESCMTTARSDQWSWGGAKDGVKSLDACIEMLVGCAGGDGNVLLNVGPMPTGEIAPEQATLIKQIGDWLTVAGPSIYGTRGGPFKPGLYGASTRKDNVIYVHIRRWIEDPIRFPALPAKIVGSRILGGGNAEVRQTTSGIEISVAEEYRSQLDTIVALELDCQAGKLAAMDVPRPIPLSEKANVVASNLYQNLPEYDPRKAVDGDPRTRWATDAGVHQASFEIDLGDSKTFRHARIVEAYPNRIQKFELQRQEGTGWKTFYAGSTIGASFVPSFSPVTAQRVRLQVLESTDGPTLWEFQLYR
ncbi:MAG: alpha-L-fucosidase [Pirellulales bacterium]|nr:alpha-L-fucosidase [Pirellulales bacterium]